MQTRSQKAEGWNVFTKLNKTKGIAEQDIQKQK